MLYYRGYQIIEYITVHHSRSGHRLGLRGVSVHDELCGVVADLPSVDAAKLWIDVNISKADRMLAKVFA